MSGEREVKAFPLPGFEESGRHLRNGHTLSLGECDWHCETCGHTFDAASEADRFVCGEDCTGKHAGDDDGPAERLLRAIFGEQGRPPMTTQPAPHTPPETRSRAGDTKEDDRE